MLNKIKTGNNSQVFFKKKSQQANNQSIRHIKKVKDFLTNSLLHPATDWQALSGSFY